MIYGKCQSAAMQYKGRDAGFVFRRVHEFYGRISTGSGSGHVICAESGSRVVLVFDGDTVMLGDHRRIRYIGINAPEVAHENQKAEPWAAEAKKEQGPKQVAPATMMRSVADVTAELTVICFTWRHFMDLWIKSSTIKA